MTDLMHVKIEKCTQENQVQNVKMEKSTQEPEEENQQLQPVLKPNQCTECGFSFTRKTTLRRHMVKSHNQVIPPERTHKLHKCLHDDCTEEFRHITAMLQHLKDTHGDTVDETQYEFDSIDDFKQWKEMEETQNYVFFTKSGAVVAGKQYYVCQRHGSQRPHRSKNEPGRKTARRNKRGSVKSNGICPARMNVRIGDSGKVMVKYIYSHNHPVTLEDTLHQPLPASIRHDIKTKLAMGVTETDIMKNLREGGDDGSENATPKAFPVKRKYFVTKQQLKGMKRHKYGQKRLDDNDAISVTLKVTSLVKDGYNPILMYKAIGQLASTGHLEIDMIENSEEIFCLGLQTKEQCSMLALHGEKVLFVDSVRMSDRYKYKLINLLVADERNRGYLVGHLVTTSLNRVILKNFFKEIKQRVPSLCLSTVVTDDANACFDAINEVFGNNRNLQHLLSRWHICCLFRKQIRENTTEFANKNLYSQLIRLLDETNSDEFTSRMGELIEQFSKSCPKLAEWLRTDYDNRRQWALCCIDVPRFHHLETGLCTEVLNSRLREYYMKGESLQRVDDLIDLLLTVENDAYWRYKGEKEHNEIRPQQRELSSHETGLLIPDNLVTTVDGNKTWRIASSPEHFVTLVQEECAEDFCEEICLDADCVGLCQHLYLCTCKQYTGICEHQHKVHYMRHMPNPICQVLPQAESQSDQHPHQSDHQSDHSLAGSDDDHHDGQQVETDHQTITIPVTIFHDQPVVHSSGHHSENDHQTRYDQADHHDSHYQQSDHQGGQTEPQTDQYQDEAVDHRSPVRLTHRTAQSGHQHTVNVTTPEENPQAHPRLLHETAHQHQQSEEVTANEDYYYVFQGGPSGSSTHAETQQQVEGILSQMDRLRGYLEDPKVRQLLLPHVSETINQVVSQCELVTNAEVVEVTEECDKSGEDS